MGKNLVFHWDFCMSMWKFSKKYKIFYWFFENVGVWKKAKFLISPPYPILPVTPNREILYKVLLTKPDSSDIWGFDLKWLLLFHKFWWICAECESNFRIHLFIRGKQILANLGIITTKISVILLGMRNIILAIFSIISNISLSNRIIFNTAETF